MFRRFVVLIASSTIAVCAAADNNVKVVEEIAAKVNGDIITRGELERKRLEIEAEAKRQGLSGAAPPAGRRGSTPPTRSATRSITSCWCRRARTSISTWMPDVTRRLAEIQVQQKISDPDKFQDFIREQTGMTFEDFKLQMKNQMLTQRVIGQEVMRNIIVPEAEMQKYYEEHKSGVHAQGSAGLPQPDRDLHRRQDAGTGRRCREEGQGPGGARQEGREVQPTWRATIPTMSRPPKTAARSAP